MRIKLEMPEKAFFRTSVKIRVSDLNYGNHLSNERVLAFAHQARVEWLASLGYSELDFGGAGIIMTDAAVVYKSEGFLNDIIDIDLAINDISRVGFDLYYDMRKQGGRELAIVKTGIVFFNYQNKKVTSIPEAVLEIIK